MCAAVYCLSWLFSPQLPASPSSFHPPLSFSSFATSSLSALSATYNLLAGEDPPFLSSRDTKSSVSSVPMAYLGDGNREDIFIPTDVERVAIPRGEPPWSCKSYEQIIRALTTGDKRGGGGGWMGPRRLQAGGETTLLW